MKFDQAVKQQALALLPIYINMLMLTCGATWLPNAVYFMSLPGHEPSAGPVECSWMESLYQLGRLVFALPGGILADKFGRNYLVIGVGCIHVLTWLTLSLFKSITLIYVVRFIQGFAAALCNTSSFNVIGEMSSPDCRGMFTAFYRIACTLGMLIECLSNIMFTSYDGMVYVTAGTSLLFFPSLWWLIESPHYLVSVSKFDEAKRNLHKIRQGMAESEIRDEYESLKESIEHESATKSQSTWLEYLKLSSTRQPLICAILVNLLVFSNGNVVILLYATVILPGNQYFSNNYYPLIMGLIQLFGSIGSALLIDAFPRRLLFIFSAFLCLFIQSFNGIIFHEYHRMGAAAGEETEFWKWTFLFGNALYWVVTTALITPLNGTMRTEIFPQSIKGLGNALCLISQAISAIGSYQTYSFVTTRFGLPYTYAVFAANSFLLMVVLYFFLPETRGKSLAQVQQMASGGSAPSKIEKKLSMVSVVT